MKQYLELLRNIKKKGTYKPPARENMPGTTSLFGYQFRHNLADGFPLLTTKQINFKHIVVELLWFLRGDSNIKYLVDNGCNIWNEDAYNYYLKVCKRTGITDPIEYKSFVMAIKNEYDFSDQEPVDYKWGDCGKQYPWLWRKWYKNSEYHPNTMYTDSWTEHHTVDQVKDLIEGLKKNPMSRRHIITAWNPATLDDMALHACHCLVQFNCRPVQILDFESWCHFFEGDINIELSKSGADRELDFDLEKELEKRYEKYCDTTPKYYLDCQLYQRSADSFLGVPYNIASYALLTEILAKICNMVPGEFIHTFGDVHIYDNHQEQVKEQLKRTETPLPKLNLSLEFIESLLLFNSQIVTFDDFIQLLNVTDFILEGYNPQSRIKAKLSTGLK